MFAAIANLRIFTKISLGVASVLGLLVVASTWTYISMSRLDSLFAEYRDRVELITLADKLLGDMNSYGFIAQTYARTGQETLLSKASEIGGAVNDGVANLRKAMRKADRIALLDRADQKNQELAQQMSDVYEVHAARATGAQSASAASAMKGDPIEALTAKIATSKRGAERKRFGSRRRSARRPGRDHRNNRRADTRQPARHPSRLEPRNCGRPGHGLWRRTHHLKADHRDDGRHGPSGERQGRAVHSLRRTHRGTRPDGARRRRVPRKRHRARASRRCGAIRAPEGASSPVGDGSPDRPLQGPDR